MDERGEARPADGAEGRLRALTMFSPLSAIAHPPLTLPLETTIRQALEALDRTGSSPVVVTDPSSTGPAPDTAHDAA